ncbi:hypothetical protein RHIZ404_220733 [Rhizobium sp. EC-SD404]|nr:hypothetical protein RHIZ404_220733 [Rhizobium sp. EC-SD404]
MTEENMIIHILSVATDHAVDEMAEAKSGGTAHVAPATESFFCRGADGQDPGSHADVG